MLQFAAPLGLLALGALLAPILIHLTRSPRSVVRLGSLRFLEEQSRRVRSLRWHEWLLLALRCALLAALALLLGGLRWQPSTPAPARWLLRMPGAEFDAPARAEWDRLRAEGFEERLLAPGFPVAAGSDGVNAGEVDAWSLLREADLFLPAGSRAVVFGPTWATQFLGARPVLSHVETQWHVAPGAAPMLSRAKPVRVSLVAAADRADDGRYLRAALQAIGATTHGAVVIVDEAPDWIFQLGGAGLPATWAERIERGAHLVTDAPNAAKPQTVARWFDAGANLVRVRQRVAVEKGVPRLADSAGEPLLTEERQGAGVHWRLAMRFHPDWSDWTLGSAFPEWWRSQLGPSHAEPASLAPEQAAPGLLAAEKPGPAALSAFGRSDLRRWCWLVAAGIILLERGLSFSAKNRRAAA